jgi:molybdopterin synthase catalytic subunit
MIFKVFEDYLRKKEEVGKELSGKFGCIVEFNGYVREHDIVDGREVPTSGLNIKEEVFFHLHEIRGKAIEKFALLEVLVYHNQGFLKVGERVTAIAIFAKRRFEAFSALEFIISEIKKYH